MKMFVSLCCVCCFGLLITCTNNPSSTLQIQIQGKRNVQDDAVLYRGGLFKVWVTLSEPVANVSSIRWKTGKADIAKRNTYENETGILADTVYLYWDVLPAITVAQSVTSNSALSSQASVSSSSVSESSTTTTSSRYLDSIAVVVDGIESDVEAVEILNILPKVDSLIVGGITQAGDSVLTLSVHPGERTDVEFFFSDAFNLDYPVQAIQWPESIGSFDLIQKSDSVWLWSWNAPNELVDTILPLIITDKGGFGTREYNLQLIVYDEAGSAWVISGGELVKYSPKGSEVARIRENYVEVADLVINSNTTIQKKVFVIDIGGNSLYEYDAYGRLLHQDTTTFESPLSVAVDVESRLLWVSDVDYSSDTLRSRVRRFSLSNLDSLQSVGTSYTIPGMVKGLSVDQFERDLVWFVSPEEDFVGYIRNGTEDARIFDDTIYGFNRPSSVSYDPVSGLAWIADSSRVILLDTAGEIRATISGFEYANSLSAAGGVCWVADILQGAVYRFDQNLTGNRSTSDALEVNGFISPASVSTYAVDQGVWIADKGAGQVIRLDGKGKQIASGTGLTLPNLIRVHQVIE